MDQFFFGGGGGIIFFGEKFIFLGQISNMLIYDFEW